MAGLALRIREVRHEKGITLHELAKRVGCSTPHMSGIERGIKRVNGDVLQATADALGVEPWELIADQEIARFHQMLARLPDEDRARVHEFVAALLATRDNS